MCGVKHAIAVSSGTSALHIALLANELGPGDEVITTPFTFIATINAILSVRAKPVFVDIDEETFNMDMSQVEPLITTHTKAILPVHVYGHMCDMAIAQVVADKYGLQIIEDACQAVMATFRGKYAGSFGTGAFSFYATKNLMTGEGGMITTNDDLVAEKCRLLRNHGMKHRYQYEMHGYNFRLTEIQAAIGLAQLERLAEFTAKRKENAAYLNSRIKSVITPQVKEEYDHVWHQYTVRVNGRQNRDFAAQRLGEAGIGTGIYYPCPAHKQKFVQEITGEISLPVAEKMAREVISLPVHPQLTIEDLNTIVEGVNKL